MLFETKIIVTTERDRDMGIDSTQLCVCEFDTDFISTHFDISDTEVEGNTQIQLVDGSVFTALIKYDKLKEYRNANSK